MTRRYYISKVELFDGSDGLEVGVAARRFGTVVAQNIGLDANGQPTSTWALCVLDSDAHSAAIADNDCIPLPQFGLDAKVSAMHTPTKQSMLTRMQAFGIDTAFVSNSDGFRDVIRGLGRAHNAAFDENSGSWQL